MKSILRYVRIAPAFVLGLLSFKASEPNIDKLPKSIYQYSYTSIDGKKISLSEYKGKKIMFVNTASFCGNTPQYKALQNLSVKYKDKLVIIGFPANDFGLQEPGSNQSIKEFCTSEYHVTFPMASKITVKGPDTDPIYCWLKNKKLNGLMDSEVKWNFQKYLVDEKGNFLSMFHHKMQPDDPQITSAIEK